MLGFPSAWAPEMVKLSEKTVGIPPCPKVTSSTGGERHMTGDLDKKGDPGSFVGQSRLRVIRGVLDCDVEGAMGRLARS